MEEKIFAMWLADATGPGSIYGKDLFEIYGSFSKIYSLSEKDYISAGVPKDSEVLRKLLNKDTERCKNNYNFCACNFFEVIEYSSPVYPQRLKSIKNPPPVLYARGRMINFDDNVCIAVVGTRSYTDSGWNSSYKIASGLAKCGAVVVTGLASGIDAAATSAALEHSGFAVGVLGTGLERIYPSQNKELFARMYTSGLVISELPPFSETSGKYFPVRNRIISGLCNGVLVGEGDVKSGAMITAQHATEQGRRVFAIPGEIDGEESSGVNKLIQQGAVPVFEAWDILKEYAYLYPHRLVNVSGAQNVAVPQERSVKRVRVFGKSEHGGKTAVSETTQAEKTGKSKKVTEITNKEIPDFLINENTKSQKRELPKGGIIRITEAAPKTDLDGLSELERKVYDYIVQGDSRITDSIASAIGENSIDVSVAVTSLELCGLIVAEGVKVRKA